MNKLSIIIPVYNGEKFVEGCLQSIIKQDNGKLEIVLVDDGSADGSEAICRSYAEKYPYVQYYRKENGGVSSARNLGLEKISGDYVWFIDMDDQAEDGAVKKIFSAKEAPLTVYNFICTEKGEERSVLLHNESLRADIKDKNVFFEKYVFRYKLNNALWNKIFKADIILKNGLKFDERIKIGEDFLFCLNYYKCVDEIAFYSESIYRYQIRDGGAMRSKNPLVFDDQQRIAESVKKEYKDILSQDVLSQFFLMQLVCGINQSKANGVSKKVINEKIKGYFSKVCNGKSFERRVIDRFLKSEGAGFLSRIKFKWQFGKINRGKK